MAHVFTDAESYFYDRGMYGEIAAKVDLCMAHTDRPCLGGECDDEHACERHQRTGRVVERLTRMRARKAAR